MKKMLSYKCPNCGEWMSTHGDHDIEALSYWETARAVVTGITIFVIVATIAMGFSVGYTKLIAPWIGRLF